LLAPLLDMMVILDTKKRFTASEAMEFSLAARSEMTSEELKRRITYDQLVPHWQTSTRWDSLPGELVQKWAAYYIRPPSPAQRILRAFCRQRWGWNIIYYHRLAFRTIGDFILWRSWPAIYL
ncbi:hypothetical protein AMATHDRAFT_138854, partial [Amanita thiersii Skay4041]